MSQSIAILPAFTRLAFDYSTMDVAAVEIVQQAAARIRDRQRAAIVDIGRELNAVKAALLHGQFTPWLRAEFGWSHGTANNYMRVAESIETLCSLLHRTCLALAKDQSTMPAATCRALDEAMDDPITPGASYAEGARIALRHHQHWRSLYVAYAMGSGDGR